MKKLLLAALAAFFLWLPASASVEEVRSAFYERAAERGIENVSLHVLKTGQSTGSAFHDTAFRMALGLAVRGGSGVCYVFLHHVHAEKGMTRQNRDVIDHELGHCHSWQEFGLAIDPHGREWKQLCSRYASSARACREFYK